jgi:SNF2 family DNA or RNA helicase
VTDDPTKEFVRTKATLVVVPGHLMGQWPREISKFCSDSKQVIIIKDMKQFNETSVADIMAADIVVVNFQVDSWAICCGL